MRSWQHFAGLLSPKFWEIMRTDGVMPAVLRAKPYKAHAHEAAGWISVVPCVGNDEFGNRYYEDLDHHS